MILEKQQQLNLYEKMLTIRYFELKVTDLSKRRQIPGFIHVYVGEEAVAVGACENLRKDDYITSTHRGHGHCIAKGCDLKKMMAEILGKRDGYCKGKGGSMHITDFSLGIIGANGIVAGGIPIATGCGLSIKLRKTDQVVICFFGDGATNQGAFHEAVNMASIWKLPILFLCENNFYGISLHQSKHQAIKNVAERAKGYNITGICIDGNDIELVCQTVKELISKLRNGEGPIFLECQTYRWHEHSEADPQNLYRTQEEVEEWKAKCPIKNYREKLFQRGILNKETAEDIERRVSRIVEEASFFARENPFPEPCEAKENIFI